jgi:hypothetical protein
LWKLVVPGNGKVRTARRNRGFSYGYYLEARRIQGDADAYGEFEYTVKRCIPNFDFPEVCNKPQAERWSEPVIPEDD